MTRATLLILLATLCSLGAPTAPALLALESPGIGRGVEQYPDQLSVGAPHSIAGSASWFCLRGRSRCTTGFSASGAYAAAGPTLRAVLGHLWRGKYVTVCARHCVRVRLIDVCVCAKLIDVYASVFVRLGVPLSRGVVRVSVSF